MRRILCFIITASLVVLSTSTAFAAPSPSTNSAITPVSDNPAGSTTSILDGQAMNMNEGTIDEIAQTGSLNVNSGTVEVNKGKAEVNCYVINVNDTTGLVDINTGTVNSNKGVVGANTNEVSENYNEVGYNGNVVTCNREGAVITQNNGTVATNYGVVTINGVDGVVFLGIENVGGEVTENYGTVHNAELQGKKLVYSPDGSTYYSVILNEGNSVTNTQQKEGAMTVGRARRQIGKEFVKWAVVTNGMITSECYFIGEEIDVLSPMILAAIYEEIEAKQKENPVYTAQYIEQLHYNAPSESSVSAVWTKNSDGTYSAVINGQQASGGWYNIKNDGDGATSSWYYFDPNGKMLVGWQWIKGEDGVTRCYYLNPNHDGIYGAAFINGTVDGRDVDKNGAWIVNGVVQTQ